MRVFVYEFVTGGGWWSVDPLGAPRGSLFHEGASMLRALVTDFIEVGAVVTLRDSRCPVDLSSLEVGRGKVSRVEVRPIASAVEERIQFLAAVSEADWTVVIAPEFAGHLLTRCAWVKGAHGRLLGPSLDFIRIASDKHDTARHLARSGVPVPRGLLWSPGQPIPAGAEFPAILKPRDGAGSQDIRLLASPKEGLALSASGQEYRLEKYHAGLAASVAILAGPRHVQILPGCRQRLSSDGCFRYLGGETPLDGQMCRRAEHLAGAVVAAMPPAIGYFGIDLILGDATDGSSDVVIEINPRLTTSYLGLRRIAHGNLAAAMLDVAGGKQVELSFRDEPVQFAAEGGDGTGTISNS